MQMIIIIVYKLKKYCHNAFFRTTGADYAQRLVVHHALYCDLYRTLCKRMLWIFN